MAARRLRTRHPAACAVCLARLDVATEVEWDRDRQTAVCVPCANDVTRPAASGRAGGSARAEEVRRRERQHDRHERVKQAHPVLGRIQLALSSEADAGRPWGSGAIGEERVEAWLEKIQADQFLVLNDRRLPRSKANIDHLVVAAGAVWVIDAKHYSRVVERRDVGGWLRSDLRLYVAGRDRSSLVAGVQQQIELVQEALAVVSVPVPEVRGALCFTGADWRLFAKPFSLDGVLVVWPKALGRHLLEPGPLDPTVRRGIHRHLAVSFPPPA